MQILELELIVTKKTAFIPLGMEELVLRSDILCAGFSLVPPYNCFPEPVEYYSELYHKIL